VSAPTAKLDVSGSVNYDLTSSGFTATTSGNSLFNFNGVNGNFNVGDADEAFGAVKIFGDQATQTLAINAGGGLTISGNVGIGTAPTEALDVVGNGQFTGLLKVADGTAAAPSITATSNNNTGLSFFNGAGSAGDELKIGNSSAGATLAIQNSNATGFSGIEYLNNTGSLVTFTGQNNATNEFRFNNIGTSGTIVFKIASTDAFKINNNRSLTAAFYGAGTATFDASGNITSVSDTRLKKNITPYNSGIKELMKLRPIQYQWNDKSGMETKGTYAGFSAQNVKEAIPLGTGQNADGYLSLQERAILATAITAIQEQQKEIEKLKKEIKKLKKKN